MKNIPILALSLVVLAGCGGVGGGAESEAKKAVLASLKDPDSAKFGQFTLVNEEHACLTVNSRNSFGGYTGDQQAMLTKIGVEDNWRVKIVNVSHESCVSFARDFIKASLAN